MKDWRELTKEELTDLMTAWGEPSFRAGQLFTWLHARNILSVDEASDLPKALRLRLKEEGEIAPLIVKHVARSRADRTAKYLFALSDGHMIESVAMYYRFGLSVCVSSQAGCDMGCVFCASTIDGCARNLTAAEMLDQIYTIARMEGERVARVVVMGSGEPFLNYDALAHLIRNLTDESGLRIGMRHITVSTCGIVPRIGDFARDFPQAGLAVSLHAPTQEKRARIMPRAASSASLDTLLQACDGYTKKTSRRITFEYALIAGENDTEADAEALSELLRGMLCAVNLIPVNPVRGTGLSEPKRTRVLNFKKILDSRGINVTIRRETGRDINGACGQLVRRYLAGGESSQGELTC